MAQQIITGNSELIRDINTQSVIRTIIEHEPVSRAKIARLLGLTKATVSTIVQSLLDKELVLEVDDASDSSTQKGRKAIPLTLNRSCGYVVSVDLAYEMVTVMTSNLLGGSCSLYRFAMPERQEDLIHRLTNTIRKAVDDLPKSRYGLIGIAIGIHGVVHHNKIIFLPYSDFQDMDLVTPLQNEFGVPVLMENEANLSVLGEWFHCHHTNEMLYISIHSGIGVGLIMRDQLVKGKNGYAGEFGHTIININGKECPCGNHGCLEQYASERALFKELASRKGYPVNADIFEQLYHRGDPDAIALLEDFITYMSIGINNLLNSFNPDIIVLNTVLIRCRPTLCQDITDRLRNNMKNYCRLIPSSLQDTSILLGGAYLVQHQFLYPNQI